MRKECKKERKKKAESASQRVKCQRVTTYHKVRDLKAQENQRVKEKENEE